jgi:hypothetical protein
MSILTAFRNRHQYYGFWLSNEASRWYWTWRHRVKRWQRALAYAFDRMDADTARSIAYDCEMPAGWFPLVTLTTDDVLTDAQSVYQEHPALQNLCADAASYVAGKWNSPGHELEAAREWALEKVKEYAEEQDIELIDVDSEEMENEHDDC